MTEPFLIAHIVRGSPAFDIAIRYCSASPCQPDCGLWNGEACKAQVEEWWIVPTSGHRAYPYWSHKLIVQQLSTSEIWVVLDSPSNVPPPPEDWPDHYQSAIDSSPLSPSDRASGASLIERLGLAKPKEPIKRRI